MAVRPPKPRKRRRRSRRRLARLTALVAIAAVVVFAARAGIRGLHEAPPPPRTSAPPTISAPPYSSAFLRHGAPWTDDDVRRVRESGSPEINGYGFPPTSAAVLIDARTGRTLYEHNAHLPLAPASTIKLFVAGAALHDLGPDYRFQTQLATGAAIDRGVVRGDVYLVGGGDPELAGDDLRAAMRQLKREGISAIDGSIVADGTLYGPDAVNDTWDAGDLEYGWAAPPSAVTIDNGAVQFTITPDPDGGLAAVDIAPPGAAGALTGHVRTASAYAENTLRIDPTADGSGFTLSGAIPYGAPQKYWRSIARPTGVAATVVRTIAFENGIAVSGADSTGKAPSGASTVLWSHRSRPLALIVGRMLFDSDNHIAEQVLRAIGAHAAGTGTLPASVQAERSFLASIDVRDPRIAIVDGSGLSASNRVTAASLAAVLRAMVAGQDAQRIAALLPKVGVEGTVRFRHLAPDATGRVRGKDGYIAGASGLAGYVATAHHGVVVYAFLVSGWQQGLDAVWNGEDDILAKISRM